MPTKVGSSFTPLILKVTEAVFELAVPSFEVKDIEPALLPYKFGLGVKVAASRAALIFAKVPEAVKLAELFPPPPKVIPEAPKVTTPPVTVKETV
ncbi:hypothetical protein D3C87_1700230 [compost metagenome]